MSSGEIHVNDIGTQIKVTVKDGVNVVDLSSASSIKIILHPPSGSNLEKTGSLFTDGTDGIVYYNTISGDINQVGKWKLQVFVDFGSTEFYSDIHTFQVYRNI